MDSKKKEIAQTKKDLRKQIGRRGEEIAAAFLCDSGFEIVEKNWRRREGELDIIAKKGSEYRIVEVKTRKSFSAGSPEESVTDEKFERLGLLAEMYFQEMESIDPDYHIDIIAIDVHSNGKATLRYLPDVG